MTDQTKDRRERGSIAVEAVLATVLFGILMIGVSGSLGGTFDFMQVQKDRDLISRKTLSAVDSVGDSLRGVLATEIVGLETAEGTSGPVEGDLLDVDSALQASYTTDLEYAKVSGLNEEGGLTQTPVVRIYWKMSEKETDDGLDNDGNGLVDEGALYYLNEGGREVMLMNSIPQDGFKIRDIGDGFLTVSITVQMKSTTNGELIEQTAETKIPLR